MKRSECGGAGWAPSVSGVCVAIVHTPISPRASVRAGSRCRLSISRRYFTAVTLAVSSCPASLSLYSRPGSSSCSDTQAIWAANCSVTCGSWWLLDERSASRWSASRCSSSVGPPYQVARRAAAYRMFSPDTAEIGMTAAVGEFEAASEFAKGCLDRLERGAVPPGKIELVEGEHDVADAGRARTRRVLACLSGEAITCVDEHYGNVGGFATVVVNWPSATSLPARQSRRPLPECARSAPTCRRQTRR